jgi:hypothetical protein
MQVIFSGIPPAVSVRYHAADEEVATQILSALTSILQTQFGRAREEKWDSHYILITIAGDPLFSPSGQVAFR